MTISRLTLMMTLLVIMGIMAHPVISAKPKPPPATPRPSPAPKGPPGPIQQGINNMLDFIKYCALYIHSVSPIFIKPNEKCCTSAKKANISLFCKAFFIPNTEKVFSPRRVTQVAKYCGTPLPVGSRCGTYRVKNKVMTMQQLSQ